MAVRHLKLRAIAAGSVLMAALHVRGAEPAPSAGCLDAGNASARIGAEIAAVRRAAGEKAAMPTVQGELDAGLSLLAKAELAHAAGRHLLALERLAAARALIEPIVFAGGRAKEPQAVTAAIFDEGIEVLGREFRERRGELARSSAPSLPAAVRAMRDDARMQATVYERTAGMWKANGDFFGGLYYGAYGLSLARAAAFDAELAFPPPGRAPGIPALAGLIDRYERELIAAYVPPVSKDRHRDFIAASAALKTAKELIAAGSPEGALYEYLRGRLLAAPITRAAVALRSDADLRAEASALRGRLGARERDDSIACLFWEKAGSLLDDPGSTDETRRAAAALVEDVVPEYFRIVTFGTPDVAATPPAPAGVVTVTLVRWPYT